MTTVVAVLALVIIQAPAGRAAARAEAATAAAPAGQAAPAGWKDAADNIFSLLRDGKCPEALALAEPWVAKHPSLAEAHLRLGTVHDNIARGFCGAPRPPRPERMKRFETAAQHFRRTFELGGGDTPWITIRALVDVYGLLALDRPDEQEKVAREAVTRFPAEPVAHSELIIALLKRSAEPEAAKAALAARATLPKTTEARFDLASHLAHQTTIPDPVLKLMMPREARMAMARMAAEMLDDVLALSPGHRQATRLKAEVLQAQKDLPSEKPLSSSNLPADESGVIGLLRLISSAQAAYSAVCGGGFYAPTLAALARPQPGGKSGFIDASDVPPGGAKVLEKHRYAIEMTTAPAPKSPAGCSGVPAGQAAQSWSATARPLAGYAGKTFRISVDSDLTMEAR